VARLIVLDAGPLGLVTKARGRPDADRCRAWLGGLIATGAVVVVAEVADYEVRRELIRVGATAGLRRLDEFIEDDSVEYEEITTYAMRRAAKLWALVRRAGVPTAAPEALDGDCLLAAQAEAALGPSDTMTIATTNPGHLARFPSIDARPWSTITG
jgi:hypothetical protein